MGKFSFLHVVDKDDDKVCIIDYSDMKEEWITYAEYKELDSKYGGKLIEPSNKQLWQVHPYFDFSCPYFSCKTLGVGEFGLIRVGEDRYFVYKLIKKRNGLILIVNDARLFLEGSNTVYGTLISNVRLRGDKLVFHIGTNDRISLIYDIIYSISKGIITLKFKEETVSTRCWTKSDVADFKQSLFKTGLKEDKYAMPGK